jgi:hypothetical protein
MTSAENVGLISENSSRDKATHKKSPNVCKEQGDCPVLTLGEPSSSLKLHENYSGHRIQFLAASW